MFTSQQHAGLGNKPVLKEMLQNKKQHYFCPHAVAEFNSKDIGLN